MNILFSITFGEHPTESTSIQIPHFYPFWGPVGIAKREGPNFRKDIQTCSHLRMISTLKTSTFHWRFSNLLHHTLRHPERHSNVLHHIVTLSDIRVPWEIQTTLNWSSSNLLQLPQSTWSTDCALTKTSRCTGTVLNFLRAAWISTLWSSPLH